MNEELEVYIEAYKKIKKNREIINSIDRDFFFDFADTMLNYIENSISKKKVKEKIEELDKIINEAKYGHRNTLIEASIVKSEFKELLEVE